MDTSHSSLYALNDALLVEQSAGHTFPSLTVIEHLQSALRHEADRRQEHEKELLNHKKRIRELETTLATKEEAVTRGVDLHTAHLRSIKHKLLQSLRLVCPRVPPPTTTPRGAGAGAGAGDGQPNLNRKIPFEHRCDECNFHSKSDVSLILHKMNHSIVEQAYVLSSTSFTTRNSNSKNIYNCPACDGGANLTRHEVYRHIYDSHTNEKPLSCTYCEYSFTHKEYLDEHIRTKHSKAQAHKNLTLRPDAQLNPLLKESWTNSLIASATVVNNSSAAQSQQQQNQNQNSSNNNNNIKTSPGGGFSMNPAVTTIITPSMKSLTSKTPSGRGRPAGSSSSKGGTELRCTFLDCNFVTISQDKLDFHMKAHINTKYKCPYCPYVSNTIIDIKRHIQKSKKHEGMKMYSCQKCGFGADCDRMFKEHLRAYHFGYEVHDTVVDYFIEEMFSNKNNKRPGIDDELAAAQLAHLQHQLQHPVLHHPPGGSAAAGPSESGPPLTKKQAMSSSLINNLMASASAESARKQRAAGGGQQSTLTTMIEEAEHRSAPQTPQPPTTPHVAHQQQHSGPVPGNPQSSLNSLINSYRSSAAGGQLPQLSQHQATNLANALGLNTNAQPVLMYHSIQDLTVGGGGGSSSSGDSSQQHAHHQAHQQQQHQHPSQFHHSLQSLGALPGGQQQSQQQQQQQHHAEALIVQQQQQQQQRQVPSRPQSQAGPPNGNVPFGASAPDLPQYVTYANY